MRKMLSLIIVMRPHNVAAAMLSVAVGFAMTGSTHRPWLDFRGGGLRHGGGQHDQRHLRRRYRPGQQAPAAPRRGGPEHQRRSRALRLFLRRVGFSHALSPGKRRSMDRRMDRASAYLQLAAQADVPRGEYSRIRRGGFGIFARGVRRGECHGGCDPRGIHILIRHGARNSQGLGRYRGGSAVQGEDLSDRFGATRGAHDGARDISRAVRLDPGRRRSSGCTEQLTRSSCCSAWCRFF